MRSYPLTIMYDSILLNLVYALIMPEPYLTCEGDVTALDFVQYLPRPETIHVSYMTQWMMVQPI
jgi:hypothetical protein